MLSICYIHILIHIINVILFIEGPLWARLTWGNGEVMVKRQAGRRDRTSLNSHTCLCKIRVTISTKERVPLEGTMGRFDLVQVEAGLRKGFPEHWKTRKGRQDTRSKKEHGRKVTWRKTSDFGSQMSDVLWFRFRSLGAHPRSDVFISTSGISFLRQIFIERRGVLGTLPGAGISAINDKLPFPRRAFLGECDTGGA